MTIDLQSVRAQFPALHLEDNGQRRVYFDNPAGTQVPQSVIDRMSETLVHANANLGGPFASSLAANAVVDAAHAAMADLLNAPDATEIVFGPNMTSLTFQISRALGRTLKAGDEIVVSEIDHDANVTPWTLLARDLDLRVRKLPLDTDTYRLDLDQLDSIINDRTRLVCIGHASNLLGTINDVSRIVKKAHQHDALVFVDAVHSVPHMPVDVQALGCDLLVCSPYKFFGPHQGVLWGRRDLLASLQAYKLRPAPDTLPGRYETGTQSHEAMAGVTAAVDYLASLSSQQTLPRRQQLADAMNNIRDYEIRLCRDLIGELQQIDGLKIYGLTAAGDLDQRSPTVSFTIDGLAPAQIASGLADHNIFAWSGHSYAVEPCAALGLLELGGVLRVGMVHYNGPDDIAALASALSTIAGRNRTAQHA